MQLIFPSLSASASLREMVYFFTASQAVGESAPHSARAPSGAKGITWTPISAGPFAVRGRLAVPSVYIAAEPRRVGQAPRLSKLAEGRWLRCCSEWA